MVRIFSAVILVAAICIFAFWVVWKGHITPSGWDFDTTPRHFKEASRQEQAVRRHVFSLMIDGEYAWRRGDLKTAETKFDAVINDNSTFFGKADYDNKARANLAKIYKSVNYKKLHK